MKPHSTTHTVKTGDMSADMLISLSMGHLKDNKDQLELSQNLQQNNIIKHPLAIHAFEKLDRKYFDLNKKNKQKLYKNEIIRMQFGQNMTTPLMHGIVLEVLAQSMEKLAKRFGQGSSQREKLNMLDIGSGRGYICFALQLMLQELNMQANIQGIDIFEGLLSDSYKIEQKLINDNIIHQENNIEFENYSLQQYSELMSNQKSCFKQSCNLVHSGIALQPQQGNLIINKILNESYAEFIYPKIEEDKEQTLFRGIKNSGIYEQQDIMKCMYTIAQDEEQVEISKKQEYEIQSKEAENQSETNKYFFDNLSDEENEVTEEEEKKQQQLTYQQGIDKLVIQIQEKEQFIKKWTLNFKEINGSMPKLQNMMQDIEMESNLKTLNVLKRQKSILERNQKDLYEK